MIFIFSLRGYFVVDKFLVREYELPSIIKRSKMRRWKIEKKNIFQDFKEETTYSETYIFLSIVVAHRRFKC